jgi:hypothetical protein
MYSFAFVALLEEMGGLNIASNGAKNSTKEKEIVIDE